MTEVLVIVVAYHAPEHLETTLCGLGGKFEVSVVDNSSSPLVQAVARSHGARYIDPGGNLGFARGVNEGLRRSWRGRSIDVLLLNPDAVIDPTAVAQLQAALEADSALAAVSPELVGPDGRRQRVMWPFPSPARAWLEAVGLGRLHAKAEFAVGAVLLLRASAIAEVGFFDERYFLYAEETDWQRRAATAGWTIRETPGIVATHVGAATSEDSGRRDVLFHAGTETYIRKWFGDVGWASYRAASFLGAVARSLVLRGERRRSAARRARVYVRGPRRLAGFDR